MTFVIGIRCTDGLVVCADRMEDDGYSVRERSKLEAVNVGEEWGVCWGVSGNGDPADRFSAMFRESLGNDSFNRSAIERKADNCLKFINKNFTSERSFIRVVMGIFGWPTMKTGGHVHLGHLEQAIYRGDSIDCCLSPEREWCCAGQDTTLTKFLMANSFHRIIDVIEAQQLGIWVTALMKKHASGVGGPTDVAFFVPGMPAWCSMTESNVAKIESQFTAADTGMYVGQYWADWHPKTWSAKRMQIPMQKLRAKIRRSTSRKLKGRQ